MTAGILSAVDPMTVLWSALVLLALAVVFGVLLAVLGKKFAVKKDAREEEIRKHLPGANCGGCGYAGCDALAAAMAEGKAGVNACPVMKPDARKAVAELLGEEADGVPTVLIVACSGGNAAADKYDYMGYGDCRSMELLGGGRKACPWGCLGMGSCADACPVHAAGVGDEGHAAQVRRRLSQETHRPHPGGRGGVCRLFQPPARRKAGARDMRAGLHRLRAVRAELSLGGDRDEGQPARHRLREVHKVRHMRR